MNREDESLNADSNIGTEVIRVALMHSLTGDLSARETMVKDATLMAIAEINQSGGLLGQIIEAVIVDISANQEQSIPMQIRSVLADLGIKNLFGGGSSATRKSLIPLLEKYQAQLWYPYNYEGLESSKNIFYTGACPNQVVQPAINWLLQHLYQLNKGNRLYLIGTDEIYSRTVNKIIRAQIKQQNGFLLYEDNIAPEISDYQESIVKIKHFAPEAVISTLSPENSIAFLKQYAEAGIKSQDIPVLSFCLTDLELRQLCEMLDPNAIAGHLASANYFQSLDTESNQDFLRKAAMWFGVDHSSAINAVMQSAYTQVFLWGQAVETAQTLDVIAVRKAAYEQSLVSPAGKIVGDRNHHISTVCRIAEITTAGKFKILYTSDRIKPSPWLGVEELNANVSAVVMEMLADISQGVQTNWQLDKDAQDLELMIAELLGRGQGKGRNQLAPEITRAVMSKLFKANQRLQKTQTDLLNVELALREANELLEQRIEQRTVQLQRNIKRLQSEAADRQQAETLLRESQQRFSAIADNVPGVVYRAVLHPNGDVSMPYISPRTQEIFGVSVEEFAEHFEWVFDMAHPEDRAALNEIVQQSASQLVSFEHEYRVSGVFKKVKWVRIISQPHRHGNGDTIWDGVIIDISHQKQIEESLKAEQEKSENLLLNILPKAIVNQLKLGHNTIASRSDNVTILFADIVDFTKLSTQVSPSDLVTMLNEIFSSFDLLADQLGLEKIKTIGDSYMVVGGLPTARPDHAEAIAEMALAMQRSIVKFNRGDDSAFSLRIGINTGSVVAGVIGLRKFIYDLWGDAVNIASRMESHGLAGGIQVTQATHDLLQDKYSFWHRGKVFIKGRGEMDTYMLLDMKKKSPFPELLPELAQL